MGAPDRHNPESGGDDAPGTRRSPVDRALVDLTDDARRDLIRRDRQDQHDRLVVAELSGTFLGTLIDLSETTAPAVVITGAGTHHRGTVATVGPDVVVMQSVAMHSPGDRRRILISPAFVEAVRRPHHDRPRDTSVTAEGPRLGELLDDMAGARTRIVVTTFGGNRFTGTVLSVGVDQVELRLDGEGDGLTIPLAAIAEAVTET